MLDMRFSNTSMFLRREKEWNLLDIQSNIESIFKNIDVLPNYKFVKSEWIENKSNNRKKEEIKKSIFKSIKVTVHEFTKKQLLKKEHIFILHIPTLVMNNFFYIGGNLKVPIFQLFDFPILHKDHNNTTLLKFKNNLVSVKCNLNKKTNITCDIFIPYLKLTKHIPMDVLISAIYTKQDFDNFISEFNITNDRIMLLYNACIEKWNSNTSDELLTELGKYKYNTIKNVDHLKNGESIKFSILQAYNIDIFTQRFMKTKSILFEILNSIEEGPKSDTDLKYKRIRFSEYLFTEFLKNVYNMIGTLSSSTKIRFKMTPSSILDLCNVSSSVHHNLQYNAIGELSSLLQVTLTGPGSFKKTNVPRHLKNLDDSHKGIFCPADTPDRDGCGVILNLSPGVELNDDGTFSDIKSEVFCSYPITLIPFMKNNDQTRLQMASGQIKQTIKLKNPEPAFIKSGEESNYLEYSTYKHIAKDNGEVIFKSDFYIIVKYTDDTIDCFKLNHRQLYLGISDKMITTLNVGEKFNKNDIICQSNYITDNDLTIGTNLLAAITTWKGYNYEDGIVLNEDSKDKFKSMHMLDLTISIEPGQILLSLDDDSYKPLPAIGDILNIGDLYCKLKYLHEEGFEFVNMDAKEFITPKTCKIVDVEIYPNVWNHQVPQFDNFIKTLINNQNTKIHDIKNVLSTHMTESQINNFCVLHGLSQLEYNFENINKLTESGNVINGVLIKLKAVYEEDIEVGDKLANRHGAKGVCCFDEQTEIYTTNGWRFFKDLTYDDKVAYVNNDRKTDYIEPTEIHKYEYNKALSGFSDNNVDFLVTPNHRMYTRSVNGAKYNISLYEKIHLSKFYVKPDLDFTSNKEILVNDIKKFKTVPYSGFVYCVTVPNGLIYVRRNNKPMWCGNSKIEKSENMPTLDDGRKVDIILNPLGIISRMNVGQLYEIHLTEILYDLKQQLKSIVDNNEIINKLTDFLNIIYDQPTYKIYETDIINTFNENIKGHDIDYAIDHIQLIQPPFQSISPDQLFELMNFTNTQCKKKLYDNETKKYLNDEVSVGYIYFNKLIHRSSEKLMARSIGPYSKTTLQPVSGKKYKGAHRLGEMEFWGMLGAGADKTLKSLITVHSDNQYQKNKILSNLLQNPDLKIENSDSEDKTRVLLILTSYLKILGIDLSNSDN